MGAKLSWTVRTNLGAIMREIILLAKRRQSPLSTLQVLFNIDSTLTFFVSLLVNHMPRRPRLLQNDMYMPT